MILQIGIGITHLLKLTFSKIYNNKFFASVIGRGGATPTLQEIYSHILGEDILNFDGNILQDNTSLGKYAFTLDKKINSKKLIEEISNDD